MVAADVVEGIVGVLARTLLCNLVELFVGAVAVSVDLFICDFVDTVVDEMSCELLVSFADIEVEFWMMVEGCEEGLIRGLEEAVDAARRKIPTKTIRGDIFVTHCELCKRNFGWGSLHCLVNHIVLLPMVGVAFLSCIHQCWMASQEFFIHFSHFD